MLKHNYNVKLTSFDLVVFETVVPADHYLRQRGQIGENPAWPFKRPGE